MTEEQLQKEVDYIATELRKGRAILNISAQELAKRAGVQRNTVSACEKGAAVRFNTLVAMLDALGLRLSVVPKNEADRRK